ncbi:SDR family NAD(P)-dependent oxidoreductase [Rhizobacter sp. Root1221]|uniref:SDR family NAD(P)-dependent oxidoreductase n=1 Tax=Rhizobacter sp. Root1221 TaxID=1736433 RepID=UPI0006F20A15|nr:SDR family oxidoreductase [Rhizobacter sp. Root1221]KQV95968.1 3-oxoacyl-ACP reductase [Rhizobacter sp. Root1221]
MFHQAVYPSLQGRTVFISGGSTGIGASFVERFHAQGANVAFVDLDADAGAALVARIANDARAPRSPAPLFMRCDVTDIEALRDAIACAREAFGPIAVLVNNAANDRRHQVEDVTVAFWDQCMNVNLRHHFFAAQAVAGDMAALGGGSIINLGSTSWMIKGPGYPAYATTKAAIHGLTRSLARDLGPRNIRVNALVPGWVMTERQLSTWVTPDGERAMDTNQCLPGRLQSDDIAAMALFLAADDSRMCTAQSFVVDGGWT